MNRSAGWCVVLLGLLEVSALACRDISVCGGTRSCEVVGKSGAGAGGAAPAGATASSGAPGAGQRSGAAGADGGEAGMEAELTCSAPLANCDQTALNGCETDLAGDPDHCGACDTPCAGVCGRSQCHTPLTIAASREDLVADFGQSRDAVYFTWGPYSGPFNLSRADKTGANERLLASGLPRLSEISIAPNELFLWGRAENLRSADLSGALRDQGFTVSGVASVGDAVYAGSDGKLLVRRIPSGPWEVTSWFDAPGSVLRPLAVDDELVVFRTIGEGDEARYEVVLVGDRSTSDGELHVLASGTGTPTRARAMRELYWVVELPGASGAFELRRHNLNPEATTQIVARERNITNFALDGAFVYVTRSLSLTDELILIPVDSISEKYRFGTYLDIAHPEIVGEMLWFYDPSSKAVRAVDLGLNDAL